MAVRPITNSVGRHRPFEKAGAPGGTDFDGEAEIGDLCKDVTNGVLYINTGTKSSPTWTVVGTQT